MESPLKVFSLWLVKNLTLSDPTSPSEQIKSAAGLKCVCAIEKERNHAQDE
jgi:hypothetical protein